MINPDCQICFGTGWVCENHPTRAWSQRLGCQCGAGTPCACQGDLDEADEGVVLEILCEETKH